MKNKIKKEKQIKKVKPSKVDKKQINSSKIIEKDNTPSIISF